MAKINVGVDTEKKTCMVDIDGETIENVSYISISKGYSSEEGYYVSITTIEKQENGIRKNIHYSCGSSEKAKKAINNGTAKVYGKNKDMVRFEEEISLGEEFCAALFPNY